MNKRFNIKFILIIISIFFFINVDVKAAKYEDLSKYTNVSISEGEKVCVYKYASDKAMTQYEETLDSIFDYVVIKLNKNKEEESAYYVQDLTLEIDGKNYKDKYNTFPIVEINNSEYLDSNICENYYIYVDHNPNWSSIYFYIRSGKDNDLQYYSYDSNATSIVVNSMKKNDSESEVGICEFKDTNIKLGTYITTNNNLGYFETTNKNKTKICPAVVSNKQNYTRISIDINSFKCENWKIVENKEVIDVENALCHYYLVDKNSETYVEGTQTEIEADYVTRYVAYVNQNAPTIRIVNDKGTFKGVIKAGNKDKKVTITNASTYKSALSSGNSNNYPKYLIANGDKYRFSNDKEGVTSSSIVYINVAQINTMPDLGDEMTIETCKDLLGSTFLDFLNNNVIKVIYIGIPILLILLTSFDFAKVVFIDDKEGIQGAAKKFGKRAIIAVLIFLIPSILTFVMNIFVADEVNKCVEEFKDISEASK